MEAKSSFTAQQINPVFYYITTSLYKVPLGSHVQFNTIQYYFTLSLTVIKLLIFSYIHIRLNTN